MFRSSRATKVESGSERGGARQSSAGSLSPAPAPAPTWSAATQSPAPDTRRADGPAGGGEQQSAGQPGPGQPGPGEQGAGTGGEKPRKDRLAGSIYAGIAVILIILIVVIDFILQNLDRVDVHLFVTQFHLPIGVMILLGAIGGALLVLLVALFLHFRQMRREHRRKAGAN
jgi:uncharacterized integral membrane protein